MLFQEDRSKSLISPLALYLSATTVVFCKKTGKVITDYKNLPANAAWNEALSALPVMNGELRTLP